jgi:plastocyanin
MKKILLLIFACLALGLVATGCGGDDEADSGGSNADQPAENAAEEPSADAGPAKDAVEVSMEGIAFEPSEVTVKTGGTVTWTNNESVGHDVTKEDGPGPDFSSGDPGAMAEGDTFEQTFDMAGEIAYVCTVHPNMTGTVTVE